MRTLFATLVLAGTLAAQSSHPAFWRYMHPEAKFVMGADIRNITGSSLWRTVRTELEQSGFSVKETTRSSGVDLLSEVDRVLVSSPGPKAGAARAGDAPVVIAISGTFNLAAIRREFVGKGARKSSYKGVELLAPDRRRTDMHAALVSPKILLLGDLPSIRAAIDNQPVADDAEADGLIGRGRELAELHDVWFVSDIPLDEIQQGSAAAGFPIKGLRGFEGGLSFQSGFAIELALGAESEQVAQQTSAMLQGLLQMGAAGQEPPVRELLERLRLGVSGRRITASLRYSEADIKQGMGLVRAKLSPGPAGRRPVATAKAVEPQRPGAARSFAAKSLVASPAPAMQPAVVAAAPEPLDEPKPLVVKIYNAGSGVREHKLVRE